MTPPEWLNRSVSRFARSKPTGTVSSPDHASNTAIAQLNRAQEAPEKIANSELKSSGRSTRDRLSATLRQKEEALSPRVLRRTLLELKKVVEPQVSEVEGGLRAKRIAQWYVKAAPNERRDMWLLMSEQFVADPHKTKAAHDQFASAIGTADEAVAEVRYRRATVSPRRRAGACCSVSALFLRAFGFWWICGQKCCPTSKATSAWLHLMLRWNTCFPPGLLWGF